MCESARSIEICRQWNSQRDIIVSLQSILLYCEYYVERWGNWRVNNITIAIFNRNLTCVLNKLEYDSPHHSQ